MGNALYSRLATHADATGATVGTIPMYDCDDVVCGGKNHHAFSSRRFGAGVDGWRGSTNTTVQQSGDEDSDGGPLRYRRHIPRFLKCHRACGTEDDPGAPFYALAQHQLLRHVNIIQFQFFLFTLCTWNYLSTIRFVFGQDAYGGGAASIPPSVYMSWMIEDDDATWAAAYAPTSDKEWMGLLYLCCSVAGLVSAALLTFFLLWENRAAALRLHQHRDDRDDDDDGGERVFLKRPIFIYRRKRAHRGGVVRSGGSEAYQALDAHAAFHDAYGDDSRGDVAPLLLYVGYSFAFVLCVIDIGVLLDLTLYSGGGGDGAEGSGTTAAPGSSGATPSPPGGGANTSAASSYGASKVGSGMSTLGAITAFLNLLYVVLPPRRWYQVKAEAYLAARYY